MNEKPDQTNPVLLEIGKILKPHGLNGEVIVFLSTNRTERLNPGSVVNTEEMELRIKASRPHAKNFIVQFKGIENRKKAEELRGNGDAKATGIYADAYNKDPEFYEFTRSLKAYQSTFENKSDVLLIDPDSDFFKYLDSSKGKKSE